MNRRNLGWLLLGSLLSSSAWADMQLNLTQGATEVSHNVYDLHMLVLYICTAIGVVVFGAMFWSMIFHRKSKGYKAASFHESTKVEILWTAIPVLILIAMAFPATQTLINLEDNSDSDITVQVTGSQWKWHYKYFDQNIEYYSVLSTPRDQYEKVPAGGSPVAKGEHYLLEVDKPLVIPVHKKVRFLITSDDVIHSWFVPAFAVKQDAVPGFINEAWTKVDKPGIYRGQCAELCGKDHGFMPIVVDVRSEADYQKWLDEQHQLTAQAAAAEKASLNASMSMDELMALGKDTYIAHCAACHQATGSGLPPAFPALKDSPFIKNGKVADHISTVFNGRSGTGMQAFGKQLSLKQLAAVVTYERNAWGNNTGDVIQAADVQAAIGGESAVTAPAETTQVPIIEGKTENKSAEKAAPAEDLTKTYNMAEMMAMGEKVYTTTCVACHQASGKGLPPVFPALDGGKIATGDLTAHLNIVMNGSVKNPAMVAFSSQLTKTQIAAVITYERNAWGNKTGDLIQPADVDAASAK